jgi:hypothetical protein
VQPIEETVCIKLRKEIRLPVQTAIGPSLDFLLAPFPRPELIFETDFFKTFVTFAGQK